MGTTSGKGFRQEEGFSQTCLRHLTKKKKKYQGNCHRGELSNSVGSREEKGRSMGGDLKSRRIFKNHLCQTGSALAKKSRRKGCCRVKGGKGGDPLQRFGK